MSITYFHIFSSKLRYGDSEYAEILRQRLLIEQKPEIRKELDESLDDLVKRIHSASRQLPLLGDLRDNVSFYTTSMEPLSFFAIFCFRFERFQITQRALFTG